MELKWQDYNKQKWGGIIQKGKSRRQEIRCVAGESPWFHSSGEWGTGVSFGSQLLAPVWMFSWWSSSQAPLRSFLCSRRWQEESRKEEVGRCQVLTTAGKWVWLGPKLLTYDYCQPSPSTDWLKRNLTFLCHFFPFSTHREGPLTCQFHSLDSHHLEWKIDKRVHNQRGRRGPVPLLLEYKGRQQASGKPSTQAENSFFSSSFSFFFKF